MQFDIKQSKGQRFERKDMQCLKVKVSCFKHANYTTTNWKVEPKVYWFLYLKRKQLNTASVSDIIREV